MRVSICLRVVLTVDVRPTMLPWFIPAAAELANSGELSQIDCLLGQVVISWSGTATALDRTDSYRCILQSERMVFFFFFGGVSPEVRTVLKRDAAICPVCTSPADLVEYDNVLRVFFIPVWKWSGDIPAIKCTSCPFLMPLDKFRPLEEAAAGRRKMTGPVQQGDRTSNLQCWSCLLPIESADFKFCPHCGAAL